MVGLQKLLKVLGVQKPVEILRNTNPNEANVCSYTSERILSGHLSCMYTHQQVDAWHTGSSGTWKDKSGKKKADLSARRGTMRRVIKGDKIIINHVSVTIYIFIHPLPHPGQVVAF